MTGNTPPQGSFIIADDDVSFLRQVCEVLRDQKLTVHAAADCQEMVLLAARHSRDPIIFEPNIRGSHWYATPAKLTQLGERRLFAITAYFSKALVQRLEDCNVPLLLRKPVSAGLAAEEIKRALNTECPETLAAPVIRREGNKLTQEATVATLAEVEWEYLNEIISLCNGNLIDAAQLLGLPRQTIYRKLRKIPPTFQGAQV